VYRQLQRLTLEVEGRLDDWAPETVDMKHLHTGELLSTLTQLKSLVHRRLQLASSPPPQIVSML